MKASVSFIVLFCLLISTMQAQVGYKKDSLQIKVYTEITYEGDRPVDIEITKVFCDYCNDKQTHYLSQQAWNITYHNRYSYKEKIKNGKAKLAHYIRVRKKDFKNIQ